MVTDTDVRFRSQVQVGQHFTIEEGFCNKEKAQVDNYLRKQGIKAQVWLKPGGISKSGRRSPLQGKTPKKTPKSKLKRKESGPPLSEKDKEYAFYFKEGDNIDSLVENCVEGKDAGWTCKACGVTKSVKSNLQNHVEKHIGGTSYSCPLCGNVRRTRYQIMCHISLIHDIPKKSKIVSMARQLIPSQAE